MKRLLLSCAVAAMLMVPAGHAQTNDQSLAALFQGEHDGCSVLIKGTYLFADFWSFEVTFTDSDALTFEGLCENPAAAPLDLCVGHGSIRDGFANEAMTCLFTSDFEIDGTDGPMPGGLVSESLTQVRYNALAFETLVTAVWSNA
ncbi:MAG: hypothetical protein ACPGQL_10060 [Thermoplasmatota archaeon]